MTDPAVTGGVIDLLKREGLIVVAIVALGWQVYWLTNSSQQQDHLWREELAAYRDMITEMEIKRQAQRVENISKVQELLDEAKVISRIVGDFEEECLVFQVKDAVLKGQQNEDQ